MIGKTLGHYQITEKLGEGGMGVVYKARDTHLDRFVAIKTLPPERVSDPERKRRFVQEAKAASALNHPNVITIHDIDQADGVEFIAMECVEGNTLDGLIRSSGLACEQFPEYAIRISSALAAAHAAGIVHRDLKPSNIMVTEKGLAKYWISVWPKSRTRIENSWPHTGTTASAGNSPDARRSGKRLLNWSCAWPRRIRRGAKTACRAPWPTLDIPYPTGRSATF